MTKEDVANLIKKYCNGLTADHPIYKAMGSGGTSWKEPYAEGIWAMCQAIATSCNQNIPWSDELAKAVKESATWEDFQKKFN